MTFVRCNSCGRLNPVGARCCEIKPAIQESAAKSPITPVEVDPVSDMQALIGEVLTANEPIWFIHESADIWRVPKCLLSNDPKHRAEHERIERETRHGEFSRIYICHECDHPIPSNWTMGKRDRYCAKHKPSTKNPAAVALGQLGGFKGGPERARRLTPERRREIAAKAAAARWNR